MPTIGVDFTQLDPLALADADTDQARTFTTYRAYWDGLARVITDTYGEDYFDPLVEDLHRRRPFRALLGSTFTGDEAALTSLLLNAWNSELGLYLVDDDDIRLMAQNQWNNVFAYYATGGAALAWLLVRDGQAPIRHRPLLRALSSQVTGSSLFPVPWALACIRRNPETFHRFTSPPNTSVSNLSRAAPCFDIAAKTLSTTRKRRLDELCKEERARTRSRRLPSGFLSRCDTNMEATTVFDFLWRLRTRSNYGDPSMFYVGTLDMVRSREYLHAVRTVACATMLLFEALVSQRARRCVVEAADHYMIRDRSGITASVLGRRLEALGLLGVR